MSDASGIRNIADAFARVAEPWQPHRLASVNDYDVKVVKLDGEFVWHSHPETDELFLVRSGRLTIALRDADGEREVELGPDDVFVVPAGVEHRPRAEEAVEALLIEPAGTVNTGDAGGARTQPVREL
ncbi:MAG: cupin domain-containing protein [Micrococcales bacterium]|nr:cupin domain-containing protein [Micrococcales bacterium]OJX69367.1 MAG: cupin [Micrococcales bacterium 72-143]